jgi:hypothetical protein
VPVSFSSRPKRVMISRFCSAVIVMCGRAG